MISIPVYTFDIEIEKQKQRIEETNYYFEFKKELYVVWRNEWISCMPVVKTLHSFSIKRASFYSETIICSSITFQFVE